MATNTMYAQELKDLRNQLEWVDEERRKQTRKLAELEQQITLQTRELEGREHRIQALEKQLTAVTAQQTRQLQIDTELAQFKDDIVHMIEQYDQRRIQSEKESDRLRRIEHETNIRELANIRKELPIIGQIQQDMELRQNEEARLANLIGVLQSKQSALANQFDSWERDYAFIDEKEKQNNRHIAELQTNLMELSKRIDPIHERIDMLASTSVRAESSLRGITESQDKMRTDMKSWFEQIQIGEHERNKQVKAWGRKLEEQDAVMEHYSKEWLTISNQYQEAKMALQTFNEWQKQVEQQQREVSELLRVESHRLQARWDTFRQENEKRWRTFELESEQRWAAANRANRQFGEQVSNLEASMAKFQNQLDTMKRIQAAQTDAIKKVPLTWLEEIEKAIQQDPNRRRQPALVTVREE